MRRLGVEGENLPTKKSKVVEPADFLIAGLVGIFPRQFKSAFTVRGIDELRARVFGNENPSWYGYDVADSFFKNVAGVPAKLIVVSHVGYSGSAYDGVSASKTISDIAGAPINTLKIQDGFENEDAFGSSGNRTGYTIENGYRFETLSAETVAGSVTQLVVDSVAGFKVGDIVRFNLTGGTPAVVYKKITEVDETNSIIKWSGVLSGTASVVADDTISVIGIRLRIWRKDLRGIVSEVEETKGKIFCSLEPEVTEYYIENVYAPSQYVKVADLSSASTLNLRYPANVSTIDYLSGGSQGTTPTTASHFAESLKAFDGQPVRMIGNAESVATAVNKAGETYCQSRWDNPKWIANIVEDQTKSQLITIGHTYQRSDAVLQIIVANWIGVDDSFSNSDIAPDRHIPNIGAVMGAWCRTINQKGIHVVPAVKDISLFGVNSVVGTVLTGKDDRTELAEAGINIIENVKGYGIIIRNFFTCSTTEEFKNGNGLIQRDFIKVSCTDSLQNTENEPNTFARIKVGKDAITKFLYTLFLRGTTGTVALGETFGQYIDEDGNAETFDDLVEIKADSENNPKDRIQAGERNYYIWFSYPAPAGSIRIGVGIKA